MTIYKALHLKDSTNKLYVKKKEGGRELVHINECVQSAKMELDKYIQQYNENIKILETV